MTNENQKFLFFYVKAGGGHLSASKTIAKAITEEYQNTEVVLCNALKESPKVLQKSFNEGYTYTVNHFPILFSAAHILVRPKLISNLFLDILSLQIKKDIKKTIKKERPDKIITTYFCTRIIRKALNELNLDIPLITVVSDNFTPPKIWFCESNSKFIVLSQRAKKIALRQGIKSSDIKVFEGLVNPRYNQKMTNKECVDFAKKNKINTNKPTVLLTGGGLGLRNADEIIQKLDEIAEDVNIVCVCGRNEAQRRSLERTKDNLKNTNLHIFGFVDFMYELINIADVVVGKAGPASVLETLLMEKPLVITSYIWEQEKGNMEFVVDNNLGYYTPNTTKAAKTIKKVLRNKVLRNKLIANISQVNIKNEVTNLAHYLYKL